MSNVMELVRRELAAFHRDEDGLNTVESILLVGAGVLVMIGLMKWLQPNVTTKVSQKVQALLGINVGL